MSYPFLEPIAAELKLLEARIRKALFSDVALVATIAEYLIAAGGKRLRPALLLLAARACAAHRGASLPVEEAVTLAAVVEFIHSATLLHDDVVDESEMRRGRQTANCAFGNAAAVLVGDFLYSRAFQMMVSVGRMRVMEILAETTNAIAEGEVLQLVQTGNPEASWDAYERVIEYKTAKLFAAAAQLGALISDADQECEARLLAYGHKVGVAFQIADDLLDYVAACDELGKNPGDDLAEGKPTFPLLYLLTHGSESEQALVRAILEQGGSRAHFAEVLAAAQRTGALAAGWARAEAVVAEAIAELQPLTPSPYREALVQLAHFAVQRRS